MNFNYRYSVIDKASKKAIEEMQAEEDQKIFDSLKFLETSIVTEPAFEVSSCPSISLSEIKDRRLLVQNDDSWNFPFDRWDFV
jgi:hypothetical protein